MIGAGIAQRNQDTISLALRGFAYQALSQLGERIPSVLQDDLEIPEYLFQTLATEAPGVRASLQQSLSTLSSAYAKVEGKYSHSATLKLKVKQSKYEISFLFKELFSSNTFACNWCSFILQTETSWRTVESVVILSPQNMRWH